MKRRNFFNRNKKSFITLNLLTFQPTFIRILFRVSASTIYPEVMNPLFFDSPYSLCMYLANIRARAPFIRTFKLFNFIESDSNLIDGYNYIQQY